MKDIKPQYKKGNEVLADVSSRFWICSKCGFKVETGNWKPNFSCSKTTIVSEDNCNMYWMNEVSERSFNES